MKKFLNILIILFIVFFIYSSRDDISSIINNIKGEFLNTTQEVELKEENQDIKNINTKEETPGPLKVIGSVFSTTADKSALTKNGVIQWTNNNRRDASGLSILKENELLNMSAKKKLDDMFKNEYFEHDSLIGVGVGDLGKEAGYEYILIGENLAMGNFKNDKAILEAWMNSPGHRANILNDKYSDIGVAVGQGIFKGQNVWLAVQHFGLSKDFCPEIDMDLKINIDVDQKEINNLQSSLDKINKEIKKESGNTKSEKIKEYNALVGTYNNLLNKVKKNIDSYNLQVKNFNACVEKSTTK